MTAFRVFPRGFTGELLMNLFQDQKMGRSSGHANTAQGKPAAASQMRPRANSRMSSHDQHAAAPDKLFRNFSNAAHDPLHQPLSKKPSTLEQNKLKPALDFPESRKIVKPAASPSAKESRAATKNATMGETQIRIPLKGSGSKGNPLLERTVIKKKSDRSLTRESIARTVIKRKELGKNRRSEKKPWESEKQYGAKIYKLSAYTTISKITKKFKEEQRQIILRKIIVTLILIMLFALLLAKFINLGDMGEIQRITGSDDYQNAGESQSLDNR